MTDTLFKIALATLMNAFPHSVVTTETIKIYWQQLNGIPDDLWEKGAERCLNICRFFPSIVELGEACLEGHLIEPHYYNPHAYHEPKKLEWPEALSRVVEDRRKIASDEKRDQIPAREISPPNREEARIVLRELSNQLEKIEAEKREQHEQATREQREQAISARGLQLKDQARFLLEQERVRSQELMDADNGRGETETPKWTH